MKKTILWRLITAFIMLALPGLAVIFVKGDAGMAVCFLLFFAVDPACCITMGLLAGRNVRKRWAEPLITPLLYLAGVWLYFDRGETAFLLYAAVYLVLGIATMLLSAYIRKKIRNK